jgi:hypothetical protein
MSKAVMRIPILLALESDSLNERELITWAKANMQTIESDIRKDLRGGDIAESRRSRRPKLRFDFIVGEEAIKKLALK